MTVYEYLIRLPQPLFEATLMGLMGLPLNSPQEDVIHEWMNSPCKDSFGEEAEVMMNTAAQLLGRTFSELSDDRQARFRNTIKDYCEVCDAINQHRVAHRKGGTN